MVLAPPNLVCKSMSTIGIWELRATPSWREPPPESLFPWYWLELGVACYAFGREPPLESLSLYISPYRAHHSSHMPLGRVYGDYGLWGRLLVCQSMDFPRLVYGWKLYTIMREPKIWAMDLLYGTLITRFYGYH